jgi:hypothetical protein
MEVAGAAAVAAAAELVVVRKFFPIYHRDRRILVRRKDIHSHWVSLSL